MKTKMKKLKGDLPAKKPMGKPAKKVMQRKFNEVSEEYNGKKYKKENSKIKLTDIGEALNKAKNGYDRKPRVKPSKKR